MQILILTCTIISVIICLFAISLSLWAIIEVKSLKNSTHKIEWLPVKDPFQNKEEDLEEFSDDGVQDL